MLVGFRIDIRLEWKCVYIAKYKNRLDLRKNKNDSYCQ